MLIPARAPGSKGLLHIGVREKSVAQIAQDGTVHTTKHVRASRHFFCRNMNLEAMPIGIVNGCAKYDAVESGPKRVGHAHRAWLAGGVHRVPRQGRALQFLAGKASGARFGVGTRIAFTQNCIRPAHQPFAGAGVYNQGAEWNRVSCLERTRGELKDLAHALFVHCQKTWCHFCRGRHAAIYHNALAHATSLASNFCMERIRRLDENRSVLFFVTGAASHESRQNLNGILDKRMSKSISRICCLLLLASLFVQGCRHSPSETGFAKVTLQADWYPQPEHGGFYTALLKGYYKEEGLDVDIQPGGPYVSVEKQVSTGAAHFGMSSSDKILESVAGGQPLVAVAATMQRDPQGIMVRKDSPIHSFSDLNGHTVAIKTGSTWFEYIAKRFQLNDVHEVPAMMNVANFVADPQYIQQAFATSEPFFAHQAGIETRVLLTSDAGYNPYRVMFTTRSLLQQHPDIVAQFVRASLKGWSDYLNDPASANAAIAKLNPALSPDWMQFSWQALRDGQFVAGDSSSGTQLGRMNPERWSTMYQQLLDLKVIEKPFDPATAYTLQFVQPK